MEWVQNTQDYDYIVTCRDVYAHYLSFSVLWYADEVSIFSTSLRAMVAYVEEGKLNSTFKPLYFPPTWYTYMVICGNNHTCKQHHKKNPQMITVGLHVSQNWPVLELGYKDIIRKALQKAINYTN